MHGLLHVLDKEPMSRTRPALSRGPPLPRPLIHMGEAAYSHKVAVARGHKHANPNTRLGFVTHPLDDRHTHNVKWTYNPCAHKGVNRHPEAQPTTSNALLSGPCQPHTMPCLAKRARAMLANLRPSARYKA